MRGGAKVVNNPGLFATPADGYAGATKLIGGLVGRIREALQNREREKQEQLARYEEKTKERYPDGYKPVSLVEAMMEVVPSRRTPNK